MLSVSEYASLIEKAIRELSLPVDKYPSLYEPIVYALSAGGKRLRPVLALMACEAFCGDYRKAMRAALGLEMFHNFTLLHDDVMDNSELRRSRQTVHAKYNVNKAILSGDTMLTLATRLVAEVPADILPAVLDDFNAMAMKVYEGQSLDMDFEEQDTVELDRYLEMIEGKTGSLLGAAAAIGATIGGASREDAEHLRMFGEMVGLAFQIQDDWLDTFGDPSTFGKKIGGDIENRKKTYLYIWGLGRPNGDGDALRTAMALESPEMRVKTVTRIYEKIGASVECSRAVAAYSSKAMSALKATSMTEEAKEAFKKLAEKLIGRKK